jgi:signal transduction histidine kinase
VSHITRLLLVRHGVPILAVGQADVQRIIKRHGGRAWTGRRVGSGATFCFSLVLVERRGDDETG